MMIDCTLAARMQKTTVWQVRATSQHLQSELYFSLVVCFSVLFQIFV